MEPPLLPFPFFRIRSVPAARRSSACFFAPEPEAEGRLTIAPASSFFARDAMGCAELSEAGSFICLRQVFARDRAALTIASASSPFLHDAMGCAELSEAGSFPCM